MKTSGSLDHIQQNLAWFLGLMEGDGHLSNGKNYDYKVGVYLDSEAFASSTLNIIKELFNVAPKIYKYKKKNCYEVYFRSKTIWQTLSKSKLPRIPEAKLNFIGGIIDAEGHVEIAGYRIIITIKNDETANEIFRMLNELDFQPRKRNDNWWRISIYGKNNLERILPFLKHPKKINSIRQIINSSTSRRVRQ